MQARALLVRMCTRIFCIMGLSENASSLQQPDLSSRLSLERESPNLEESVDLDRAKVLYGGALKIFCRNTIVQHTPSNRQFLICRRTVRHTLWKTSSSHQPRRYKADYYGSMSMAAATINKTFQIPIQIASVTQLPL